MIRSLAAALLLLAASACAPAPGPPSAPRAPPAAEAAAFPAPDRPVAAIVTDESGAEEDRDAAGEAQAVMDALGIKAGDRVADIGAGAGYFTVRLSPRVGPEGRVIAQDVTESYQRRLRARVERLGLDNVEFVLGAPDDARLPPGSVDVALLVRMYHEIEQPYALMWRLREALAPGGRVAISERARSTQNHGTPPRLLRCELAAVGYEQVAFHDLGASGYLAVFAPSAPAPEPSSIVPCKA